MSPSVSSVMGSIACRTWASKSAGCRSDSGFDDLACLLGDPSCRLDGFIGPCHAIEHSGDRFQAVDIEMRVSISACCRGSLRCGC